MQRTEPKITQAKSKFINFIKNRYPDLSEKELQSVLSDTEKLIETFQKISTEPQYQLRYKIKKKKGTKTLHRIIDVDYRELKKVLGRSKKDRVSLPDGFRESMNKFIEIIDHKK